MYPSYNAQKALEEERVRALLDNAQPQPSSRAGRLFAELRNRLAQPVLSRPQRQIEDCGSRSTLAPR